MSRRSDLPRQMRGEGDHAEEENQAAAGHQSGGADQHHRGGVEDASIGRVLSPNSSAVDLMPISRSSSRS